jgi:hypothetical protein
LGEPVDHFAGKQCRLENVLAAFVRLGAMDLPLHQYNAQRKRVVLTRSSVPSASVWRVFHDCCCRPARKSCMSYTTLT